MRDTFIIKLRNTELEVTGIYTEEEKSNFNGGFNDGHPDSPSSFTIEKVEVGGVDVTELLEVDSDQITDLVLIKIES